MTQEDKDLLLKDICARLPYFENWVQFEGKDYIVTGYGHGRVSLLSSPVSSISFSYCPLIEEVKPYLRPMSSMTEEERRELKNDTCPNGTGYFDEQYLICPMSHFGEHISYSFMSDILNWLNAHHFDYRGLIEKGLAIEASEGMYTTK